MPFGTASIGRYMPTPGGRITPTRDNAEVNLMSAFSVGRMNDDGLQDAVLANVLREFVELGVRNLGARVFGVFVEAGAPSRAGLAAVLVAAGGAGAASGAAGASSRSSCRLPDLLHGMRVRMLGIVPMSLEER